MDEEFINDAFATLQGFDFNEQEIVNESAISKGGAGGFDVSIVKGDGSIRKEDKGTTSFKAQKTIPAKLQYIIDCLQQSEELPYYEQIDENIWGTFTRDTMLEIVVDFSFTKIEQHSQLADSFKSFNELFDSGISKTDNDEAVNKMIELGSTERKNGLPCILRFVSSPSFPCFAYLNEDFIKGNRNMLSGQVTVLCKVSRKINKGESVELTNIIKTMGSFAKTREQKHQHIQNIKSGKAKDFNDTIKGPATEVIPMAIYR